MRNRDAEENAQGSLPDDERVQVSAIWVAEIYTPSTLEGLLKAMRDLGWESGLTRSHDLSKWMNDVRQGRRAGWTRVGIVSPANAKDHHFLSDHIAHLPSTVRAALPTLVSLTPSLTALVIVFILNDDAADSLEAPLRAQFTTMKEPTFSRWEVMRHVMTNTPRSLGYSEFSPNLLRRAKVRSTMDELERSCIRWVRDHLPGAFASFPTARFPTAVLLVTECIRPLSAEARKVKAFDGLGIDREYAAWESDEWPGTRLALPGGWDGEGNRLLFGCRRRDAFQEDSAWGDATSNSTIAQRADDVVSGLLSRWAISCLLDSYHETLSELRDRMAQNHQYRPVRDLKGFRSLARTTLYDIGLCSEEIVDFAETDIRYRHDVLEMAYAGDESAKKLRFADHLKSSQTQRAGQVRREASLLQSMLSTTSHLSQTISNIRVQRVLVFLTLASLSIALWAAFLASRGAST